MATEADHIALANKNHDVLLHLLENAERFPEWIAVTAFYKAVQIIEAVFVHKDGRCCHGHQKRLDVLKGRGYQYLHKHYRALWSASSIARYLVDAGAAPGTYSKFSDYMSSDQVVALLVKKRLYGVECEAIGLLGEGTKGTLLRLPEKLWNSETPKSEKSDQ
jgi:hypothetical protein